MTQIQIRTDNDITMARNVLRKRLAAQTWTPPFRARSAATLTSLGEAILNGKAGGTLMMILVNRSNVRGLELRCSMRCLPDPQSLEALKGQLATIVDDFIFTQDSQHTYITAKLWQNREA